MTTYKLKLDEHLQDLEIVTPQTTDARTNFLRTLSKIVAACCPESGERGGAFRPTEPPIIGRFALPSIAQFDEFP
jgi:hypothetical protein